MIEKVYKAVNIDDIKPYGNNPRINDEAVADVIKSISECGELDPIEIDENNVILSGHTRLKAYQHLGYTTVDCLIISGLTEEQKTKYRIYTNKTGETATWDFDKLKSETEDLDFSGYGFDINDMLSELEPEEKKQKQADKITVRIVTQTKAEANEIKKEIKALGYKPKMKKV